MSGAVAEKLSPFDVVKNINKKEGLLDVTGVSMYVVLQAFSNTMDTVLIANECNKIFGALTPEQVYRFLYSGVRKSPNRFGKWHKKPAVEEEIQAVMEMYNYSRAKAEEVIDLIDKKVLKELLNQGGKAKGKKNEKGT